MHRRFLHGILPFLFGLSAAAAAAIQGTVLDPSGAPIDGAQVSIVSPVGVIRSFAAPAGAFECDLPDGARLVISAPGFAPRSILAVEAAPVLTIRLDIAPRVESVRVAGSAIDVSPSEQGSSVTVITPMEIRERNQGQAVDLLRTTPGIAVAATGPVGGMVGMYIRGGDPKYNLVTIDGVPVNAFGGNFDFSYIPSESLERVEVVRGPQSATYGSYANSGVVNFVTREPASPASMDVVAEGGSHAERRFAVSGGGFIAGFGVSGSASQLNTDGPVANSDYRNQGVSLKLTRRFARQSIMGQGSFNSNENGVPGPWGSDPMRLYPGLDAISRNKNNFAEYMARYQADIGARVRQEISAAFFRNNNGFVSAWPFSVNKDLRAQADSRTILSLTPGDTASVGFSAGTEQIRNSYITDASFQMFPIRRRDLAVYGENHYQWRGRLYLNVGVRAEFLTTSAIPADGYMRPALAAKTITSVNPKIAAAYVWGLTRFHGSFGTGMRPPEGFVLGSTNNPALKPERTRSFDAGVERTFFRNWLSLDGTCFQNRFYDLIVFLNGAQTALSRFQSDNLANSRTRGAEVSARLRPARWVFVEGSYTYLDTEILSLDGSSGVAQKPYSAGQQLARRPKHSGSLAATFRRGRATADITGEFRGSTLDIEPNWGASYGFFRNPGFVDAGVNLNYAVGRGVTLYGNLRNALNRRYEEIFGFPSPLLNFAAGVKWTIASAR